MESGTEMIGEMNRTRGNSNRSPAEKSTARINKQTRIFRRPSGGSRPDKSLNERRPKPPINSA